MKICLKTIILVVLLTSIIACKLNKNDIIDTTDMIRNYIQIRYDGLSKDSFFEHVAKLDTYYSTDMDRSESWTTNNVCIESTYETISKYGIETEVLEMIIAPIEDARYAVECYVLYSPEDIREQYYIAYQMIICTVEENDTPKIRNIEITEHIPVFTGGKEIVIDHSLFDKHTYE